MLGGLAIYPAGGGGGGWLISPSCGTGPKHYKKNKNMKFQKMHLINSITYKKKI